MTRRTRRGFTQIDVAVLLGIGIVLLALLPGCLHSNFAPASHRSTCKNNLQQIGLALHSYEITHKAYPPGFVRAGGELPLMNGPVTGTSTGNPPDTAFGWMTFILPEMDQGPLFKKMFPHPAVPFGGGETVDLASRVLPGLHCPADPGPAQLDGHTGSSMALPHQGTSSYPGNFGVGVPTPNVYRTVEYAPSDMQPKFVQGIFGENTGTRVLDIRDGLSNVIYVAERRMPRDCNLDFSTDPVQGRFCGLWAGISGPNGRDGLSKAAALLFTAASGDPTQFNPAGDLQGPAIPGGVNPSGGAVPAVLAINALATPQNGSRKLNAGNDAFNTIGISSWHVGGANVVLGDGVVRFLNEEINDRVLLNLCRKSDGQSLGAF